jgi:hypothetical protein
MQNLPSFSKVTVAAVGVGLHLCHSAGMFIFGTSRFRFAVTTNVAVEMPKSVLYISAV